MEQGLPQAIVTAAFAKTHAQLHAAIEGGVHEDRLPLRRANARLDLQMSTSKNGNARVEEDLAAYYN